MAAKLYAFQFPGSTETLYWLEERLLEVHRSHLIGIAAVCMYSNNGYTISIKGEIRRAPIITRGLLPELDYLLGRIIRGE